MQTHFFLFKKYKTALHVYSNINICESLHVIVPMTSPEAEVMDFINGGKCNFYKISYTNRNFDVRCWYQMVT